MRHWTLPEIREIYDTPLLSLLFRAQQVARVPSAGRVQTCHLVVDRDRLGPEDCAYCPQSAHYDTPVSRRVDAGGRGDDPSPPRGG
jgi:biotin synthase